MPSSISPKSTDLVLLGVKIACPPYDIVVSSKGYRERVTLDHLRYYWLVVRTAFSHSLSVAQCVLFLCIVAIGTAIWLAPQLSMTVDLPGWARTVNTWAISVLTLGTIFAIRLVLAPYWIWRDQQPSFEKRQSAEALNEVFNRTRELSTAAIANADDYKVWESKVDGHAAWMRQVLHKKLPAEEINTLIAAPAGPLRNMGGRFGRDHNRCLNYLLYLEQRVSRAIERYS